jgi:hypothetical protein
MDVVKWVNKGSRRVFGDISAGPRPILHFGPAKEQYGYTVIPVREAVASREPEVLSEPIGSLFIVEGERAEYVPSRLERRGTRLAVIGSSSLLVLAVLARTIRSS